ncbi:MAG: hypothetical protein J6Y48_06850, partial [Clostridia bacterium]|nr:hypothetical protein [Clostridia bacterium]
NEAWLVYSLEDLEGKYTGMDVWALNFTSTLDTVTEESDAEHPEIIHQTSSAERMIESSIRKEDHTNWYVYWLQFPDEIDMTERTIKAGAENVKIERETIRDLDTILKEHGKTEEGITTRDYVRKAGQPAEIKVLDNAEPLNISLGSEEALLTGIGWIDGKLHVQVQKKTPSEIRKGNNTYGPAAVVMVSGIALQDDGSIDSERTNEMNGDCQPVQWTDFSTGSAQRYEEWILDCKPDEPIKLMADVVILEDMLTDDWSVEFPLSMICDEAGIEEIRSAEGSAAAEDAIRNRAEGFFAAWQERDASGMALRCVPSEWSDMTDEMIRRILAEKKLVNWQIDGMERYPDSPVMTIRCRLNTEPAEGGESSVQEYRLIAKKAKNNIWYFEPDSLLADADNVIRASEIAKENIVLSGGQDDMEGQTESLPDYLQCLNSFLSCWSREDTAGMLAECPPEWEEEYHLSDLLAGFGKEMGIPGLWRIGQSYGTENDPMRAADCEVWLRNTPDDRDGWYHIDAKMQMGEDGKWYFIPFIASEYRPVRVKENNIGGQTVRNDLLPDGFTMEKLKAFFPEVTDSLRPLNLSCEKNSIRMELLYGGVTGYRYYLIYSLQDLEGIHPDREIEAEMKSTIGETEENSSTILLNWDEAEHKGIYLFAQVYTNPVEHEDRTVTAKIGHIWFRKTEETDLNQILMTYGKTEEGMEAEGEILRGARESGVKVLDNSNPLNIPLGKSDIVLTGIGWIDGKLHVRIQNKGRENRVWGPDLYISNAEFTASPLHYEDSENLYYYGSAALPIEWYDNDEGKVYQREDILNCAPADMDKIQLRALVSIQESVLTDDWSVEFPLSMICAEEK